MTLNPSKATPSNILGSTSPEEFLAEYWQQKPLLIRQGLVDYIPPISADELAGLSLEAEVESRIVENFDLKNPWHLRQGPFNEEDYQHLPEHDWTLLVQAIDLWVPESQTLLAQFDFLPRWRLDDIMVSFAAPGGSVGPHFDQYDVFLVQVEGQRRWQIGGLCDADTAILPNSELQIIEDFNAQQEWLLEPGDILYLPPRVAHWGIAETECMTYSVGYRSPSLSDMIGDLAIELVAEGNDRVYADPVLELDMASVQIDPKFIQTAQQQIRSVLDDEALLADWFARFMTRPKYPELTHLTSEIRRAEFNGQVYMNGERQE